MGKAIGALDKHSICKGTPNEGAISGRVKRIKDAWQAAVKLQKETSSKRAADKAVESPTAAKRVRQTEPKKVSAFSSLIKKVASQSPSSTNGAVKTSDATSSPSKWSAQIRSGKTPSTNSHDDSLASSIEKNGTEKKKTNKRVKWVDHFGGDIAAKKLIGTEEEPVAAAPVTAEAVEQGVTSSSPSWSDRKKRDRLRERELLAQAK